MFRENHRCVALIRNLVLPGFAGLFLNAVNFYEVGLNTVRLLGPPVGTKLISLSQSYFDSGLLGLTVVSVVLGLAATRYWIAWLAFYAPALLARVTTGTVLFFRGEANIWPIYLAGELILAIASLALFWMVGKVRARRRKAQSDA